MHTTIFLLTLPKPQIQIQMRKIVLATIFALALASCTDYPKVESSLPYHVKDGTIVLDEPSRAPGQESALSMACEPIDTVRIGFIGLGMRGSSAVQRYTWVEGIKIVAICDLLPERVEKANKGLEERGFPRADGYSGEEGWKELCDRDDIDLVYIVTPWELHTPISLYALEHGKHVACEVPSMLSVKDCWDIVDACERTRKHFMMLENRCYNQFYLAALNMAKHGLFGEIYHAEGCYIHNLDAIWPQYYNNWRLEYNQAHAGDNYPTHGIGPVCQLLDIHRGDRMTRLVSMDTGSFHGAELARESMGTDEFAEGDHTVTLIRTERDHQIQIHHNVYAARPFDRMYEFTGTKGFATDSPNQELAFAPNSETFVSKAVRDSLCQVYMHPITARYDEAARHIGGHGGMDYTTDSRLIYCLRNGLPLDEDVYDAAEWCCIAELSRISILSGSMPVAIPDFTRGDWNKLDGWEPAWAPGDAGQ